MLKSSWKLAFMSEEAYVFLLFTYKPNTIKPKPTKHLLPSHNNKILIGHRKINI